MTPRPPATRWPDRAFRLTVAAWLPLAALLTALVVATALYDRTSWPSLVGDEATYLMQAESLAFDLDLAYSAADYERFVRHWGRAPEGVILQKGSNGGALVYGKPFFYAAWAAPFTRLSPTHGPFVANAVLLALASIAAARALRGALGAAAPLWVAVFVFASVTFAHVFWAHMDLFLAGCTAFGLALLFGTTAEPPAGVPVGRERRRDSAVLLRWAVAGVLLAMVAYSRPLYATLLVPAAIASWRRRPRRAGALGLVAGVVLLALFAVGVHVSLAGSWTSYGAERRSFNSIVGFPGVDVPEEAWGEMIREWGNASWLKRRDLGGLSSATSFRLWGANALYFAAGRSVGLLPYFAPALLAMVALLAGGGRRTGEDGRRAGVDWARWALLGAVLVTAAGFLVIRPFNFYGGGGALANRYLLPVYPALWFLVSGRGWLAGRWPRWIAPAAAALVAAPFLWPLWSAPAAYPVDADGVFRYVSAPASRWLPFETTQNHLKPGGPIPEYLHDGLWVKLLDPELDAVGEGEAFRLRGDAPASLLVGRDRPLEALEIAGRPGLPPLRVEGGEVRGSGPRRRIELDGPAAVHPMWWTRDDFYLYELTLDPTLPGSGGFELTLRPLDPDGGGGAP